MNPTYSIRKLFRIAFYTSTAIGIVAIGPAFLIGIAFGNINLNLEVLMLLIGFAMFGVSLFVFIFWSINIGLLYLETLWPLFAIRKSIRFITSYLLSILLLFSIRLCVNPIFNDTEKQQELLKWKLKALNIQQLNVDITQLNNVFVQLLIIVFVIVSVNTVVIIIQEFVLLSERKSRIESENNLLKFKNIEAENQKLKQQLQPHFLFNSLNVLKTLIRRQPDKAEAYLKRLSDFLRASVSYNQMNTVSFKEELKLSIDYIEMQKIRFDEAILFEIDVPEEVLNGFLPLFSIQSLLENAIKHNAFTIESPLKIQLFYGDGQITVQNNIQPKLAHEPSSGMGLINLSERYRIISGDEISIEHDNTHFSVSIKVLSNEDCNY